MSPCAAQSLGCDWDVGGKITLVWGDVTLAEMTSNCKKPDRHQTPVKPPRRLLCGEDWETGPHTLSTLAPHGGPPTPAARGKMQ